MIISWFSRIAPDKKENRLLQILFCLFIFREKNTFSSETCEMCKIFFALDLLLWKLWQQFWLWSIGTVLYFHNFNFSFNFDLFNKINRFGGAFIIQALIHQLVPQKRKCCDVKR